MDLKKVIHGWIDEKLSDPEVRKEVIDKWNASVNIPILNENVEFVKEDYFSIKNFFIENLS